MSFDSFLVKVFGLSDGSFVKSLFRGPFVGLILLVLFSSLVNLVLLSVGFFGFVVCKVSLTNVNLLISESLLGSGERTVSTKHFLLFVCLLESR